MGFTFKDKNKVKLMLKYKKEGSNNERV